MKKYIKPDAVIETFLLSQSIATCGWDMNLKSKYECHATGDTSLGNYDLALFTDSVVTCEYIGDNGVIKDKKGNIIGEEYCYENGTGSMRVFNS